jgi:hypothetical protein
MTGTIVRNYPINDRGRIDAVIVDYKTLKLAEDCLASLVACPSFASVTTVDACELGWTYAQSVNNALKHGTADIVLALNADTRMIEPPTAIFDLFDNDPTIGIIGPRQITPDGLLVHAGIFGTNQQPVHRLWQATLRDHDTATQNTQDAVYVPGSVMFARRACWEQVDGLLETRHYFEDTFACFKARRLGWRVLYTGQTTWEHLWNSTPIDGKATMAADSQQTFRAACAREGIACG